MIFSLNIIFRLAHIYYRFVLVTLNVTSHPSSYLIDRPYNKNITKFSRCMYVRLTFSDVFNCLRFLIYITTESLQY